MAIKVVLVMNGQTTAPSQSFPELGYTSKQHGYGFTESYYDARIDGPALRQTLLNVVNARAALLPAGCFIVGARLYQAGSGTGTPVPVTSGNSNRTTDQVNVAVLVKTQIAGNANQRLWWIHAIPDDQVTGGEFTPDGPFRIAMAAYLSTMGGPGIVYHGVGRGNLTSVITISALGLITFSAANPFGVGQYLALRRITASGRRRGANLFVQSIGPLPNQCTVSGWQWGDGKGGTAYLPQPGFFPIGLQGQPPFVRRAGTRRVGRPTDEYRGRKSAKH